MVNINIEIPEELHKELKLASVLESVTLKELVITTLDAETDVALKDSPFGGR